MKQNRTISKILVPIAGAVILTTASNAAVLAQYNFTGTVDTTSVTQPNSTGSDLGIGVLGDEFSASAGDQGISSTTPSNTSPASAAGPHRFVRSNSTTTTAADAFTANDYFKFTLTPNATFLVNLTDLFFDYAGTGTSGTPAVANIASFFVRSSAANNFTTDVGTTVSSGQLTGTNFQRQTISLTGANFQNLTGLIEFRIYVFNSINAGTSVARLDNITLNGDIAPIPEPGSLALVGSLGVLALLRRRRA